MESTAIRPSLRTVSLGVLWLAALLSGRPALAQVTTALQFVPVTPCRVMDTRNPNGTFGGPIMNGASSRDVPIPQSACGIPATAQAYSLNLTVVPPATLFYLSIWPTGQAQPVVSTLNAFDGRIVANAAIVPAGVNGAISVYVSNSTHVIMDINGYFVPASTPSSLAFYPVAPCRVADTRGGFTGAFGAPSLAAGATRGFPIPNGVCNIPSTAQAYSLNVTVVPSGPLGYLTAWPAGQNQPIVSTLNSLDGDVLANAAIVPAGAGGAINVYVTNPTNVILDINGYFAPPGSAGAEAFYPMPPCRVADTRGNGLAGAFGQPSMGASSTRTFPVPTSTCNAPAAAQAYSMNVTVVPPGPLGYVTAWPAGSGQPVVSTLNSFLGKVTANAAVIPSGQNGAVNVFVTNTTDLILDINGFFGASGAGLSPSFLSTPAATATTGRQFTYAPLTSNPNPPDPITFSLLTAPSGMTIDSSSGQIQWTPASQQTGAQQVQVRAIDAHGRFGLQAFSIAVSSGAGVGFITGGSTVVATQTIGSNGGTIAVSGSGTAIDGARVVFPAGALSANTPVTISFNRGTVNPNSGVFSGAALVLDVTGPNTFSQPVSMTVPYTGGPNAVPVPYFADTNGRLRPAQLTSLDRAAGTFTFQTFHASLFTWLFGPTIPTTGIVTSPYLPLNDGFQIVNYGSTYNRDGECLGMTGFSLWWLLNEKAGLGNFYPKYYNIVGTDLNGRSLRGQNVIATRAFTSIAQKWNAYLPEVDRQLNLSPAERYASIYSIISNTGYPVLIHLYHITGTGGNHSVLAYEVNSATGKVSIYDPNLPGTTQQMVYSNLSSNFIPYCNGACYDGIIYIGDGSLSLTEPYSNIVADAQNAFSNSGGAVIDINSHTNNQTLSSRLTTLSGVVHSGQLLVTKLTAIVGSNEFSAPVNIDGSYSIPIALSDGTNHIKFRTEGTDFAHNLMTTSNNFDTKDFALKVLVPASIALMTLTWDKNDTDVDTYVIDPTGDYSAYYHQATADGGVLDQDIITGFGPEHWTLLNTNTVRYNQPYRFRVHYYSDHGNGPTNYTVTIELYTGTSRQVTYTYTGSLAVSNNNNTSPAATGADWRDIATITLTQAGAASIAPSGGATAEGGLNITVPVPPASERLKRQP